MSQLVFDKGQRFCQTGLCLGQAIIKLVFVGHRFRIPFVKATRHGNIKSLQPVGKGNALVFKGIGIAIRDYTLVENQPSIYPPARSPAVGDYLAILFCLITTKQPF